MNAVVLNVATTSAISPSPDSDTVHLLNDRIALTRMRYEVFRTGNVLCSAWLDSRHPFVATDSHLIQATDITLLEMMSGVSAVRVRFAPSPTGQMHLGGLRTALYNFLFARANKGAFVLRIEDTDRQRLVPGCAEKFESTLNHYGLTVDEGPSCGGSFGPYVQSQRLGRYRNAVDRLIDSGHAYHCFCSPDRLELIRRDAMRQNRPPRYDNRCRTLSKEERNARRQNGENAAVRFRADPQNVQFTDLNYGAISQQFEEGDFVLLKSDEFPTYHLANVVDDHEMRISHVIRGVEWLSSTNKHVLLYRAFDWPMPSLVHLPLLMRDAKKKLSKRDADAFVEFYDRMGCLPEAVLNYLLRNGSGIRDHQLGVLYSLEQLIERFDLNAIGRRDLMVDQTWLDKYGAMAFRAADVDRVLYPAIRQLVSQQTDWSAAAKAQADDPSFVRRLVDFLRSSEETFSHLSLLTEGIFRFFFWKPENPDKVLDAMDRDRARELLEAVVAGGDSSLTIDGLKAIASGNGLPYPKLLNLIRLSLIDSSKGPPIAELVQFLGVEEIRRRLKAMLNMLKKE